jgi:two-component system chemotaxis sensor kinase CheA
VEDSGSVLSAAEGNPETQVIVVICREGGRHVGIAVSHVLDVTAGSDLFEAGSSQRTSGVTLLKEKVTGIVNLGGVQALEVDGPAQAEWNEVGEAVR